MGGKPRQGKHFWQQVDTLLLLKGLRQADLVRATGIASGKLSVMKKRLSMPNAETACLIAQALHTSVEFLVTGKTSSDDFELDLAFEDIRLGKKTREIALLLPNLNNQQADLILGMMQQMRLFEP